MKKVNTNLVVVLLVIVGLLGYALLTQAGNLEASAAPAPKMRKLDEVEPRILISQADIPLTISTPGSYYLTEDVTAAGIAITVAVNDVTIDLAGFALVGPGSGTNYGIYMEGRSNVEIRNGTVRDFYTGIQEYGVGRNHRVINVRSVSNRKWGIFLYCNGALVKDCTASDNGTSHNHTVFGIYVGNGSTVTGNTTYNNGNSVTSHLWLYGIYAGEGCTVTGNTSCENGDLATADVYGIYAGNGSTVTGNTVYGNGSGADDDFVYGIYADEGCTVTGNTARDNGDSATGSAYGIYLGGNNLVNQNTAYSNGTGAGSTTNMNNPGNCTFGTNHAP